MKLVSPVVRKALCLALALAGLFSAARAGAGSIMCKPNYDYSVEVDGSYPKNATLYQSDAPGKYFIDVPACKNGLLMDLHDKRVVAVPRDQVKAVNGALQVAEEVSPSATAYALSVDGPIVAFQAEDRKVRILRCLDRPPVIGEVELNTLVADRAEYREAMKAYAPDAASIEKMNKYGRKVQLDVFFATWCPHCKEYMPKFLRVMSEVKNPNIKLNLYGVPKGFGVAPGPWQGRNINSIPTIIVKIDGKEITRMGSQPGATPEVELAGTFNAVN